ncbi:paralemmin-3 isoform X2 [Girardinichthys multiradiatus]|uniref:paralemmin-3 isoform X2 n=1 Tax=Girardinichthys multiradiatus TaxID=208333 RepID=UPI001FAC5275|nr:paralemmin-3 isoform X2 [Girardinichthys multiradiatus]
MDETEKYQQRLEAIAEKRRLQEEQDKARREKEDERLRQQQLKRKSLRDQWLMEGSPLPPSSTNAQNTFSSLRGTEDPYMEKHTDKLQSEDQQVTAQRDHGTEAVKVAETRGVNVVLENGETTALGSGTPVDEVKINPSPPEHKTAIILTNGGGTGKGSSNHDSSGQSETNITGPVRTTEDTSNVKMESEMSVAATAFDQVPNANMNEEWENRDGTLVMRATCVYIPDEGNDVPGHLSSLKDQQESMHTPEGDKEISEVTEQEVKTERAPETSLDSENGEAADPAVKAKPSSEDGRDLNGDAAPRNNADEETEAEGHDEKLEDPDGPQPLSTTNAVGSTVALVPIYSEAALSALIPEREAETKGEAPAVPEEAVALEEPACKPDEFQEVLLTHPPENHNTEAESGEQEALLQKVQASNLYKESAGSNSLGSSETQSPNKDSQGEKCDTPNRKTCHCCSLM